MILPEDDIDELFARNETDIRVLDPGNGSPRLHISCRVNATQGLSDLLSQAELSSLFEVMIEDIKLRGYGRCESAEINVKVLAGDLAVASNIVVRYNDDEEKLERLGAIYALRKAADGWRYTMIIIHSPMPIPQ